MSQYKYIFLSIFLSSLASIAIAQEDLLGELEAETKAVSFNYPAFKAMKIGNLQSTKVAAKGDLYLYVSHRFGSLKDGVSTFFGLDNANTKIQLVYGLSKGLQVGISRESLRKTYAGSVKMKLAEQNSQFPLNITAYGTINLNTALNKEQYPKMKYADRLSYASQLLISRRISNKFSVELAPTFIRQNLVLEPFQKHNQLAFGIGARYKLTKRLSLNVDYVYNPDRATESVFKDPLTIGIDIETGGHVFQLLFSNAQSTNEPGFISNAEGDWGKGDIFFGFNIVRVF
jgi:predicted porin